MFGLRGLICVVCCNIVYCGLRICCLLVFRFCSLGVGWCFGFVGMRGGGFSCVLDWILGWLGFRVWL